MNARRAKLAAEILFDKLKPLINYQDLSRWHRAYDLRELLEVNGLPSQFNSLFSELDTSPINIKNEKNEILASSYQGNYYISRTSFDSSTGKKIFLKEGLALDTLKNLSGSFDMAFVDADKENYLNYYEALLPIMRPGGLIVVDNVLWSGRVLNPKEPSDHAIHKFNQRVMLDHRVEKVMLTIRDGVSLLRKR